MTFWGERIVPASSLALVVMVLLSGCLAGKTISSSPLSWDGGLPFTTVPMAASSYHHETLRWQAVVQNSAGPAKKAEAHVHLAALYLASANPQKSYHDGYLALTRAMHLWPELQENIALVSWLELLTSLETERQQTREESVDFENKLSRLQQQNSTQRQELVKLRETIDRLTRLELSVERKRRAFK